MKKLTKVLLINWHSFSKELIEIGNINFLTGKNAVGKSTIVDAIQLVILGDTRGTSFNKAASEKSGRTVLSYLKGEIGGDEQGNKRYIREGDFASYVALEFYDDVNNIPFVIGLQFDVIGDKLFSHQFIYDGTIPENCYVESNRAMFYKAFKEVVKANYKNVILPDSLASYKEEMRKKLGQLTPRFFSLFKKAVPFQPIYDIRKFITEFVCDEKYDIKGDLEKMQENIKNYTSLEEEAKNIQKRINYLENVKKYYDDYARDKNKFKQANYLVAKLEILKKKQEIENYNRQIEQFNSDFEDLRAQEENIQTTLDSWKGERDELIVARDTSDAKNKQEAFGKEKSQLLKDMEAINHEFSLSATRLISSFNEYVRKATIIKETTFDEDLARMANVDLDLFYAKASKVINKAQEAANLNANNLNKYSESQIIELVQNMSSLEDDFVRMHNVLDSKRRVLLEQKNEKLATINTLRAGKKCYPTHLMNFKRFIEEKLYETHHKNIELAFLADLMEIKDKKWQPAIECYLGNQRFSFVIDSAYFKDALTIYNQNRNIFNDFEYVIIDSKKVFERGPFNVLKGSLATEIDTDNKYVRSYIDFLIGTLMKVETIDELNKYDRAITPTCMLYQQFSARQMNARRIQSFYVGKRANESQIDIYTKDIERIDKEVAELVNNSQIFASLGKLNDLSTMDVSYHFNNLKKIYRLDDLQSEIATIDNQISNIDMSDVYEIEEKIKDVDDAMARANNNLRQNSEQKGIISAQLDIIKSEKLAAAKQALSDLEVSLEVNYPADWVDENISEEMQGMLKYINQNQIQSKLAEAKHISEDLARKKRNLDRSRTEYIKEFNVSIDINSETNEEFDKELDKYRLIELPKFQLQIGEAKEKSYDQFKEDLLAKLKSSIEIVYDQIEILNRSLKNFQFGRDRYEFVVKPNVTYIKIYEMIMDDLLMQDARTNSNAFYEKHKETIDEFFSYLTEAPGVTDAERKEIIDKNITRYTDYRTYLDFDLLVINSDTKLIQSLAASMNTKSGGETQTPFYISILASIASEYRIDQNEGNNTPRLILFDEAFNKMDAQRIKESIELLKQFNLQAILVAPPEKIADIAPLVDRNLCVIRNRNKAFVRWFDKTEIETVSA